MERAENLTKLRGDAEPGKHVSPSEEKGESKNGLSWRERALARFSANFVGMTPENAQRIILWCVERNPSQRPSAEELLMVSATCYERLFSYPLLTHFTTIVGKRVIYFRGKSNWSSDISKTHCKL